MHILDPDGINERSKYKLKRRLYKVPGPNFIWHVDGYDKLKPFGFAIHGCVDRFSRKIIWLQLGTTNNKPEVIYFYYLKAIQKFQVIPTLVRSDHGTENCIIESVHQALRWHHKRIESAWGRMRRHSINYWINFFKSMVHSNDFDRADVMTLECLRYCFGPLIQYDLDLTRQEWNRHSIRKQKIGNIQSGKSNFLYYEPTTNSTENYGHPVNMQHLLIHRSLHTAIKNFLTLLMNSSQEQNRHVM